MPAPMGRTANLLAAHLSVNPLTPAFMHSLDARDAFVRFRCDGAFQAHMPVHHQPSLWTGVFAEEAEKLSAR